MNIVFSWKDDKGEHDPQSQSDFFNSDGISLLDCILMDNGGLPYLETVQWLNEGIERGKSVAAGEFEVCDWSRETWGVEFSSDKAKIYSLYDEDYFQELSLGVFLTALREWVAFLQSKPDDRKQKYSL